MVRNRTLLAVSFAIFAAYTGIGMVGPVRVLYAESQGASLGIIGAMASAYLVSNFVAQYPAGWLADRVGRRLLLALGLIAQAALSILYLLVSDPTLFVALRVVEGLGAAAVLPSARALVADSVAPEKQGSAFGIFSAFFNAGFLFGPAIGGLLASTSYESAFYGAALARVVALVVVLAFVPRLPRRSRTAQPVQAYAEAREAARARLFSLALVGAYVLAFGDYLYLGFDLALLPLWMHDQLAATTFTIGVAYTAWAIPSVALAPVGGRVADRARRYRLILIFGLAQVPIYVAYGLSTSALVVVGLFAAHGVLYSFIQPAVDAHVAASSVPHNRARAGDVFRSRPGGRVRRRERSSATLHARLPPATVCAGRRLRAVRDRRRAARPPQRTRATACRRPGGPRIGRFVAQPSGGRPVRLTRPPRAARALPLRCRPPRRPP